MPVLPHLYPRSAIPADTRIIESRQVAAAAQRAARSTVDSARYVLSRVLSPTIGAPTRRNVDDPACQRGVIQACYAGLDAGPQPGAVVGILLGSIAGFLLLMWLLFVLSSGSTFIRTTNLEEEDVVVRRRRSRSPRSRRSGQRSTYQAEMRRSSPRPDRVIRQERIVRDVPQSRRDVSRSRVRESVITEEGGRPERRVEGDDIVEVIEEHSSVDGEPPPPRRKSRRGSSYR